MIDGLATLGRVAMNGRVRRTLSGRRRAAGVIVQDYDVLEARSNGADFAPEFLHDNLRVTA